MCQKWLRRLLELQNQTSHCWLKINDLPQCFSHNWLTYCLRHADMKYKKYEFRHFYQLAELGQWWHCTVGLVLKNGTILQLLCFNLFSINTICETWLTAVPNLLSTICSTFWSSLLECVSVYFCHQQMAAVCTSLYFFFGPMDKFCLFIHTK
jgi:hypothetical protein